MLQHPELIVEQEFNNLLTTDEDCSPIEVPFLYRRNKRRRDSRPVPCKACNGDVNGIKEGSLDCPYCLGSGTEWEQGIAKGWFAHNGFTTERTLLASISDRMADSAFFKIYLYTKADIYLKDADAVLIPALDADGKIKLPLESNGIFSVFESFNYRSTQTPVEYYRYRLSTSFDSTFRGLLQDG